MKRIFHWTEYSWGLAKQYGIDPENEPDRYQPFLLMATQLWEDIVVGRLLGRSTLGIPMREPPIDSEFRDKGHCYFTAQELDDWKNGRGYLFDNWKAPALVATSPLKKPANSKRIYAAEVAEVWAAVKKLQSSPGTLMTERDLSEAVAKQLEARGFNGPQGNPLSAGTIRRYYNPDRG
jgi:hypothetical protein